MECGHTSCLVRKVTPHGRGNEGMRKRVERWWRRATATFAFHQAACLYFFTRRILLSLNINSSVVNAPTASLSSSGLMSRVLRSGGGTNNEQRSRFR
jgi:hypothetical protein